MQLGGKVTSADSKTRVTSEKRGDEWSVSIDGFDFHTISEADIVGD